jgi:hypothetical protein
MRTGVISMRLSKLALAGVFSAISASQIVGCSQSASTNSSSTTSRNVTTATVTTGEITTTTSGLQPTASIETLTFYQYSPIGSVGQTYSFSIHAEDKNTGAEILDFDFSSGITLSGYSDNDCATPVANGVTTTSDGTSSVVKVLASQSFELTSGTYQINNAQVVALIAKTADGTAASPCTNGFTFN